MLGKNEKQVKFGQALARNRFVFRLFIQYIPAWILVFVAIAIIFGDMSPLIGFPLIIFISSIIPVLIERNIQKNRKRHGFSVWGDATEDYAILDKMQELKVEKEARENLGIDDESSVDKTDIRYWHGLLKDGIISQDEFDRKKEELI